MAATDPLGTASVTLDPSEWCRIMSGLFVQGGTNGWGIRSGIHPGGGDKATISGMTVTIADFKGALHVPVISTVGVKMFYGTSTTFAVPTAHASLTRIDKIYVRVWDADVDPDGLYKCDLVYLTGTAGSGAPAIPTDRLVVQFATVTITAGSSTPSIVYDAPYLALHSGVIPCRTTAELPTLGLYEGMLADIQADNKIVRYSGSGSVWDEIARVPTLVTSGYSAATGWATSALRAKVITGPVVVGLVSMTRTGADLTGGADGNISPDTAIVTLPASLFPNSTAYVSCGNGSGNGECSVSTAGVVSLRSWTGENTITSSSAAMRIQLCYEAAA